MVRRIIVAGGRDFTDYELAKDFITACIQKINPSDTLLSIYIKRYKKPH